MRPGARALVILLGGCGGESADPGICHVDGGAACFQLPTAPMIAHAGDIVRPAATGCGAVSPVDSLVEVSVSGVVRDYNGSTPVPGATVEVYDEDGYDTPVATAVADDAGAYQATLPVGTPDVLYGKVIAPGYVDVYVHQQRADLTQPTLAGVDWLTSTDAFLGTVAGVVEVQRQPGTATLATIVWDCERGPIEHAAVAVSATAGERDFVAGASVFYTLSGALPLPVPPEMRADSSDNGAVAIFNAPVDGRLYVQVWGFPDEAALDRGEDGLALVAEHAVVRFADAGAVVNLWANQD
jgi:hypothetical protein